MLSEVRVTRLEHHVHQAQVFSHPGVDGRVQKLLLVDAVGSDLVAGANGMGSRNRRIAEICLTRKHGMIPQRPS